MDTNINTATTTNYAQLWRRLTAVYPEGEAQALVRMLFEVRYGLSLADLCMGRESTIPSRELEPLMERLLSQEPVQYVLGRADFCGRVFTVSPAVLIPRPETEELCRWVTDTMGDGDTIGRGSANCRLLDVGTGSGCIAVTLASELSGSRVWAWDVSEPALLVARENARRAGVDVTFERRDALAVTEKDVDVAQFDVIVSNPPYVCDSERHDMEPNVLEHEPHVALFVPDDDPLLFYRAIATWGRRALREGGWLFFEINPLQADNLRRLLTALRYEAVETRCDQEGKTRFIRARR